jgi:hypothetical protein
VVPHDATVPPGDARGLVRGLPPDCVRGRRSDNNGFEVTAARFFGPTASGIGTEYSRVEEVGGSVNYKYERRRSGRSTPPAPQLPHHPHALLLLTISPQEGRRVHDRHELVDGFTELTAELHQLRAFLPRDGDPLRKPAAKHLVLRLQLLDVPREFLLHLVRDHEQQGLVDSHHSGE